MTGDLVCFGEMLLRLSAPGREHLFQTPRLDAWFAGAEANVAIGYARLGGTSRLVTRLPDDAVGEGALDHLRRAGVGVSGVQRGAGRLGTYYLTHGAGHRAASVIYDRAHSLFAETPPGCFDWPALLQGAGRLHLSGITPALGPKGTALAIEAAEAAQAAGVPVSFDGNWRGTLWSAWDGDPRAILRELVSRADLLFGNHRDIGLLLDRPFDGAGPDRRREAALALLAAFPGVRTIASTARHAIDAERHLLSARIDTREGWHQADELPIGAVVDRIGTGDAFVAGVLHALPHGMAEAAETGLALAVLKHGTPGDVSWTSPADLAAFRAGGHDVRR